MSPNCEGVRIVLLVLLLLLPAGADERALAAEWAQLRQVKGHFQGGEWVAAVDAWAGRKHHVLSVLGDLVGKPGTSEERVRQLLGKPDRDSGGPFVQAPPGSTVLVYEWRGMHDFLYLICVQGRVSRCDWWMAGE